ncbi:flavin-containing monooxygenase 5-like [Hemitrygon akajei]|uniref:flavin-containing monooxygenase 5-like n=1 Tax=Hemitrygon akajei TaxID=2704970 RepID=UPI003BF9AA1C
MVKRVAIIGAGASGLACIKCCLDEGLEPVCFEKSNDIGGLWNFREDVTDGRASIYKSLIINTSKDMMAYSDFPVHEDYPNYMHHSKIMEYFRLYAAHFNLLKYIRFATSVSSITQQADFSTTGQWDVVTSDTEGNLETTTFDAILVCVGHHADPYLPLDTFPGIEKFKGQHMHSKEYKDPQKFEGKRVVVVGIGNSGVDLSVEISQLAKQVFLSTRRGAWVITRVAESGYPADLTFTRRFYGLLISFLPELLIRRSINSRFDHGNYGLQPSHSFYSQHPTVNDDLPNRILSGRVLVKPNVKQLTESAAIFEDDTMEDIDTIIFATGYSFAFPFLNESVIKVNRNHALLYKNVFPPQLEQPTLAIIGLVQPLGAIMPISEMQARWATRVFKGLVKLPSVNNMMADILEKKENMAKRYVSSQRHTIQVDFIPYMDEIAELIGVKPNIRHLLLTDPQLAFQVFLGPCTPFQFRLMGPGKWPKARETILTQWHRTIKPTKTRVVPSSQQNASWPILLKFLPVLVVLCAVYLFLY